MSILNLLGVAREGQRVSGPDCDLVDERCRPMSRTVVLILNLLGVAREGQSVSGPVCGSVVERRLHM